MINPKELRLGNVVVLNNEKYHPISHGKLHSVLGMKYAPTKIAPEYGDYSLELECLVDNEYKDTISQYNSFIEPIPLTEDILLKIGAYRVDEKQYNLFGMQLNIHNGIYKEYVHQIDITSLHQLQNVFYFTRQKELQINL